MACWAYGVSVVIGACSMLAGQAGRVQDLY